MFKFIEGPAGVVSGSSEDLGLLWGDRSMVRSNRFLSLPQGFTSSLEATTTRYFAQIIKYLRSIQKSTAARGAELLTEFGCPPHQWQYMDNGLLQPPGLVRLDLAVNQDYQTGIYELQPRPGGMGYLIAMSRFMGRDDLLVPAMRNLFTSHMREPGKKVAFLICEATRNPAYEGGVPPYLAEFRHFANAVEAEIIFEEEENWNPDDYGALYVRGTFLSEEMSPAIRRFMDAGVPFLIPPGYLMHLKAWAARFPEIPHLLPTIAIGTSEGFAFAANMPMTTRGEWVIKPSYAYGAAGVTAAGSLTTGQWRQGISDPMQILQRKFLVSPYIPELDARGNLIQRIFMVYDPGKKCYQYAGGFWNARAGTIRVHGATDTVFGLLTTH